MINNNKLIIYNMGIVDHIEMHWPINYYYNYSNTIIYKNDVHKININKSII